MNRRARKATYRRVLSILEAAVVALSKPDQGEVQPLWCSIRQARKMPSRDECIPWLVVRISAMKSPGTIGSVKYRFDNVVTPSLCLFIYLKNLQETRDSTSLVLKYSNIYKWKPQSEAIAHHIPVRRHIASRSRPKKGPTNDVTNLAKVVVAMEDVSILFL